ncbi:hypothetical protein [Streptomyces sp. NPDC050988]|uniref:hypothetical protein n=1 Tax=Streptomyces sp. NPDC050988 TaxID=3365637 RepID=UPI0037BC6C7D
MSPTAPSTSRIRGTGEVRPEFFQPVPVSEASYDHLAAALTRQIIALLKDGTIRPGDVLYQLSAIMDVLTRGHSSTARRRMAGSETGTVTDYVARRYGLLRHRPVRVDDPTPPNHPNPPRCWEISAAAPLLVPVVEQELGRPA